MLSNVYFLILYGLGLGLVLVIVTVHLKKKILFNFSVRLFVTMHWKSTYFWINPCTC